MPKREETQHEHWDLGRIRESLIAGTAGMDIAADGLAGRVSDVPLFRMIKGQLWQAVRLWVRADEARESVTFAVRDGSAELDRLTVAVGTAPQSLFLLVPEVGAPRGLQLEIADGPGGPVRIEIEVRPQRKWSVFLIHQSHLDIGYTDPQAHVLEHHQAYFDAVLDLVAATDGWPEPAQFRWNVEATWPLQHWLRSRPAVARNAFIERARQGRIEVNALPFSMHTEVASLDELAHGLRFADELREKHGLQIVSAMQTDVPGTTVGLAPLLIDAGIHFLAVAHNYAGRSVPHLVGGQDLTRPFYWQAPDGKRLLVWYTDTPHGVAYMEGNLVGLATDYSTALASLPEYLNALAQRPYPYGREVRWWVPPEGGEVTKQPYPHDILHLRVQSTIADNAAPSLTPAEIVRQWNETWAHPRLRMATSREFFEAAEGQLGEGLDTFVGDWTDWWADGIGSGARPLGFNRIAQGGIRAAQTLHTVADVLGDDPQPHVAAEVDRSYEDLALFDEHTWGAAKSWEDELTWRSSGALQWAKKASFAYDAFDRTNALAEAGLHRFAALGPATEALASLLVFNPSAWSRTDLVRAFIPESRVATEAAFTLVDAATRETVPHVLEDQAHAMHRPRGRWASFTARDIPPLGYARYELVATGEPAATSDEPGRSAESAALESEHYRLELDPLGGYVVGLRDKIADRELVDTAAPFGFNQYLYDRYASAPGFNHLSSRLVAADLTLLGSRSTAGYGVVVARSITAVWDRVTLRLTGEGIEWLETTFTLLRGVPRLDIANRLCKIGTAQKESVYFAFPFNMPDPTVSYEITGGVTGPDAPQVPGSARHFRAIRHWVALEGAGAPPITWATMEAPLIQLGNIHLPYTPFPETIAAERANRATIYSWALNNIWDTNFPHQQGGEMTFRYAVAAAGDLAAPELGARTAAAMTTPLLGVCRPHEAGSVRPDMPPRGSFCMVDRPEVEVTHLAPSRRGHDLVAFLQSTAAEPVEATLAFDLLPLARAWVGNFLERNLAPVATEGGVIRLMVAPGSLTALVLDLGEG